MRGRLPLSPPRLPADLAVLIAAGGWPRGHFPGNRLHAGGQWRARNVLIDLHGDKGAPPPHDGELRNLIRLSTVSVIGDGFNVALGSLASKPVGLPRCDAEQAICIACGARIGDDTWILLDFRTDPKPPRVIGNQVLSTSSFLMEWRIIADCWQDFFERLTGMKPSTSGHAK